MMRTKRKSDLSFHFGVTFLTAYHLYGFYYESESVDTDRLHLARFCRFSHTWEKVRSFSEHPLADLPSDLIYALPLPWAQQASRREVLLFFLDHCDLLTIEPMVGVGPDGAGAEKPGGSGDRAFAPVTTTLTPLSLLSMLSLPEDGAGEIVINVELALHVNWLQVVADPEHRAVYALVEVAVGGAYMGRKDRAVFRLDYTTRRWNRLELVERRGRRLARGHFMALHDGHLYIGLVRTREMQLPKRYWSEDQANSLEEVVSAFAYFSMS